MGKSNSQAANAGKGVAATKDGRQRVWAFLAYADSSYPDWQERLDAEHIEAIIGMHDRDVNPDGEPKKLHWHVMLMFEGKKSVAQINEIRERVLGPNYNPAFEEIGSIRGYARYMRHLDNPEKAQYGMENIRCYAGVDYDAIISLPSDDVKMAGDMMEYIREHEIEYFSDFMLLCKRNNADWFSMLVTRKSHIIVEFIKSESYKRKEERAALERQAYARPEEPEVSGEAYAEELELPEPEAKPAEPEEDKLPVGYPIVDDNGEVIGYAGMEGKPDDCQN